ncbi:MAG: rhomboid family intramembrane serine protease [Treponema sp.]|nr:rhomboid family intramembrane serine protease [Treponema sp.]
MAAIRKPFKYSYHNITLWLICINVAVYLLTFFVGRAFKIDLMNYLGLSLYCVFDQHFWWQPVTYMFTHSGFLHLLLNMLALFFFGFPTEKSIGSKEFILLYMLCGVLIGLSSIGVLYLSVKLTGSIVDYMVPLVGASGAVYSILLTYAVCYPRAKIFIWGIIPVPAPLLILIYFVVEFVAQIWGSSSVAHFAHLLGFLFAWLYLVIRIGVNPIKVWKNAYKR